MNCAVLFGGTGFIGAFMAYHLESLDRYAKIYLLDIESPWDKESDFRKSQIAGLARVEFVKCDVRRTIDWAPAEAVSLVLNLAAIHREPGHDPREYYETNLLGAENVCRWAEQVGCGSIVFTSSIAPYGVSEELRDEESLPVPMSAYGGSKLCAEKIHIAWQAAQQRERRLVIVRPGVVFGPGEGGNVTRLIKAVLGGYFVYVGNRNTRKAGVYVKELCRAVMWVLDAQRDRGGGVTLFNMSMNPGPSIYEYVSAVERIAGRRVWVPTIPFRLLLAVAHVIDAVARPLGLRHAFSPVRIWKLVRSNNILPAHLVQAGYEYEFDLDAAFKDWRKHCPEDWGRPSD